MICHVNASNGIPIYEQIARQVKFAVASKGLLVGEHVPSVRELAMQAAVNANTVARAYRDLQGEGILTSIRGMGLAVSPEAYGICKKERAGLIRERLRLVIEEAAQGEIPLSELRKLIDEELKRYPNE